MHDQDRRRVSRRGLRPPTAHIEYADQDQATALARMLGGLIEANLEGAPARRRAFERLRGGVGIEVVDAGEAVTLEFLGEVLTVHNGLGKGRLITIRGDSSTVMELSNLRIGAFGIPVYWDSTGRSIIGQVLAGKLKIQGMLAHIATLNRLTRVFSVR